MHCIKTIRNTYAGSILGGTNGLGGANGGGDGSLMETRTGKEVGIESSRECRDLISSWF